MCALLSGCLGYPQGVTPVDDFDVKRYLGTWYEIARLDHSFERGMDKVTVLMSPIGDLSLKRSVGMRRRERPTSSMGQKKAI
jgi:lipocalin